MLYYILLNKLWASFLVKAFLIGLHVYLYPYWSDGLPCESCLELRGPQWEAVLAKGPDEKTHNYISPALRRWHV